MIKFITFVNLVAFVLNMFIVWESYNTKEPLTLLGALALSFILLSFICYSVIIGEKK